MNTATDDRLTFLSAVAVDAEIEDLLPQFKQARGIDVDVHYNVKIRLSPSASWTVNTLTSG